MLVAHPPCVSLEAIYSHHDGIEYDSTGGKDDLLVKLSQCLLRLLMLMLLMLLLLLLLLLLLMLMLLLMHAADIFCCRCDCCR